MNLQYNNPQLMTLTSFDNSVYSMTRLFDLINEEVSTSSVTILSQNNTSITAKIGTVTAVYTGNFSQNPATVNSIKLTSGISQITGTGNVSLNVNNGDFSGFYNNFTAISGAKSLVMQGVFNVDIFGDVNNVTLTSFDVTADGYKLKFSGNISADGNFNITGGTITSFFLSDPSGHTIFGDHLSISALQFDSFTDPQSSLNLNSFNNLFTYLNSPSVLTGNDVITAGAGNDTLTGGLGHDILDGGAGIDTAVFNVNKADVYQVRHLKFGGFSIQSADGADTVYNVEKLQFLDGTISGTDVGSSGDIIRDLIATKPIPTFPGATSAPTLLSNNAVPHLEYQYNATSGNDIVYGNTGNDFITLGAGDDAGAGGLGDDTIEGGTGSNFLTGDIPGGATGGRDTFYIDGRGITNNNTWSGITDFVPGEDDVAIWGWVAGKSHLVFSVESDGAVGYKGATFHYDLDGNNTIDISITFTGLSLAQVPHAVAGVSGIYGYLAFA
jgi:Ca2+-binding RTX toxin-like protein